MDETDLCDRQDNYVSEFKLHDRVQTPAELGAGWSITQGVVTGFDQQGYPIISWEDGEFEGASWEDEEIELAPAVRPRKKR